MVIFQTIEIILRWHCVRREKLKFHHLLPFHKGKRDKIKIYFFRTFYPFVLLLSGRLCDSSAVTQNKYCISFWNEDLLRDSRAGKKGKSFNDSRMLCLFMLVSFPRFITISSVLVHQKVVFMETFGDIGQI